jgi:hypothetical protein
MDARRTSGTPDPISRLVGGIGVAATAGAASAINSISALVIRRAAALGLTNATPQAVATTISNPTM